ncbi:capsid protein [WigFec circovirus 1]|uniref:Capsid protein n=1 Tax=WigFec circovirus 1 TaxID=2873951 RepID=A0AAX1PCW4_9CIRC|nr:capsid protein [WigFec circovirus 1]QZU26806.1 capsid protein [WigFec circovirus 1]QZU26808.1 capsid protein [WigFec circovirus 1]QZU26810.1 capsid protein [WigFec circovirus 1]QZU26812.1 capsid protein [WigFec circovirus 1]QZU26814.1 capsid protein [WigFec circovirus 1]
MASLRSRRIRGRRFGHYFLKRRRYARRGRRHHPYHVPRPLSRRYAVTNLRLTTNESKTITPSSSGGWFTFTPTAFNLRTAWTGNASASAPTYLWDYYRIRWVRVEIWPTFQIFNVPASLGSSAIDLDNRISETPMSGPVRADPLADRSSRRTWTPAHRHKRFFTPKPALLNMSGASSGDSRFFQPTNLTKQFWLNCKDDTTTHHGIAFSLFATNGESYTFQIKVTYYIQFREFLGPTITAVDNTRARLAEMEMY